MAEVRHLLGPKVDRHWCVGGLFRAAIPQQIQGIHGVSVIKAAKEHEAPQDRYAGTVVGSLSDMVCVVCVCMRAWVWVWVWV